jgi:gliding motility-associated-like protein
MNLKLRTAFIAVAFSTGLLAQHATDCPGVPGACGFVQQNQAARQVVVHGNPQTGNGTLGNVYNNTKCGLNYMAISQRLGQRFTPAGVPQPAPFAVNGLQTCDTIEKAILYVEGSGTGAAQTVTITPPAGPAQNFNMNVVGTGPDKCWGYAGSVTYSADVSSIITSNGTYNLSNVFTSPPTSGEDMDGATLIVIYSNRTASWAGTLVIDDGCIEVSGGVANYDMNYAPVCGSTTNAQAFCCVGDIQMPVGSLTMNGTNAPFTWNWWNFVSVSTTVNAAQSTSNFNLNSTGDCFNLCVAGMYWQTTTCAVCPSGSSIVSVASASTPANCNSCDGTATVTPSPAGTYTYSWSPSGGSAATASSLCAGTYTCTIGGGCISTTQTVSVSSAGNLSSTAAVNNVSCNGGTNGSATANPTGGTGPYTYNWSPVGGTGATASNLSPGTYTCVVTDANNCTFNQIVTITQPAAMAVNVNTTLPLCSGQSNGTAIANTSGGSPVYNYVWAPVGGNNDTATGLPGGSYTVTVTDANGCSATHSFTLTSPPPVTNSFTIVPDGCNGPGSASCIPGGGLGPYSFLWFDNSTSSSDQNLTAGSYTVMITDANGCSIVDTAIIPSTNPITIAASQQNITCFGSNNGSATAVPSGGTGPYTYFWSPFGGNSQTATNLSAGQFTVTITDVNGCSATQLFQIIEPPAITSSMVTLGVSCNGGSDGSATMNISGGSAPFTYNWSPSGGPGQTSNNLGPGTYTVVATDSSGCTTSQIFTITQPTALTASVTSGTVCPGGSTNISATAGGGTGPYVYIWTPGGSGSTISVSPTSNTSYTVTITDSNGCSSTAVSTVTMNPVPVSAFTTNANNGVFSIGSGQFCLTDQSTGATAWYWDLNGIDSSTVQNPCVTLDASNIGTYCVTLYTTNSFGCTDTALSCVEVNNVSYSIPNVFTPNGDGNNEYFIITNTGMESLHCEIYNRWGELVYEWDGTAGYWDGKTKNGKEASDGVYYYTAHMTDMSSKIYDEAGFVQLIRGPK